MQGWRVRSLSGWTMFIFGVLAFALGIVGIIQPEATLQLLSFETVARDARPEGDYTLMFVTASSMASLNMGAYYVILSLREVRLFYVITVPFRMVTFTVFMLAVVNGVAPAGFVGVAVWELVGALATGGALWWESRNKETEST
jgi:hypothetical protein